MVPLLAISEEPVQLAQIELPGGLEQVPGMTQETILAALDESFDVNLKKISPEFEMPKVEKKDLLGSLKKATSKDPLAITFNIDLDVKNNTDFNLSTQKVDLSLYADTEQIPDDDPGKALGTGSLEDILELPAGASTLVPAVVHVRPDKLTGPVMAKIKKNELYYRLDATFYFGFIGFEVPYTVTLEEGKQ